MTMVNMPLPDLLYRVAKAFDLETALKLADNFGGQQIWISRNGLRRNGELVKVMGPKVAAFIVENAPGEKLLVPLGPASAYKSRTMLVRELIAAGKSSRQIVKLVRCTQRTVEWNRQQLRELKAQKLPQLSLFPPN